MWWMGRLGRQSGPPQEFAVAVSVQVETPGESLPTLDLRRFTAVGAKREEFLREVRAAARGPGFFYLTGHGIEDELTRGVLTFRDASLPCPKRTSSRSRWSTRRISAATIAPGTNTHAASRTGGSRWISGRSGRRFRSIPWRPRGTDYRVRTNGPRPCRSSSRPCSP